MSGSDYYIDALLSHDVVFAGRVAEIEPFEYAEGRMPVRGYKTKFEVQHVWKGASETVIILEADGSNCNHRFERDTEYLVFASYTTQYHSKEQAVLSSQLCLTYGSINLDRTFSVVEQVEGAIHRLRRAGAPSPSDVELFIGWLAQLDSLLTPGTLTVRAIDYATGDPIAIHPDSIWVVTRTPWQAINHAAWTGRDVETTMAADGQLAGVYHLRDVPSGFYSVDAWKAGYRHTYHGVIILDGETRFILLEMSKVEGE